MKKTLTVIVVLVIIVTYISLLYVKDKEAVVISSKQFNVSHPSSYNSLKVMTYNIHHGVGLDSKLDLNRVAGIIKESGADIIGLNEVDSFVRRSGYKNEVKELADQLKMNYVFGPTINIGLGKYGNAILSRYPIESAENQLLPAYPNLERRGLLSAKIILNQRTVYIMTTHLSLNKEERDEQLNWLEDHLQELKYPFILMGDFNTGVGMNFAFRPLLQGLNSFPAPDASKEIDLFFSNLDNKILNAYTIKSTASDHLPVVIQLNTT